ncbi:unnamed protein product (macronuclear) [Paramecium tetraurelia]|uniref:F-box domain-containing protein n=1 Tax=Paramecium tetraurelia TaxID=5888 RepID=A0DZT5_PARTE|nr:uncharacterized protein GSPATT00021720001 [Paramecium tetraurelia]CAK88552.1 unnamed protein product [Paramecium tetraurelia]|eukprot:XP_001455949.1 hypothetical protein (macronuclear) [Paramecium tetraurelia strain d4-2]
MMKQIPKKNGQQQNAIQNQINVQTQNKQGLKQFKNGNQQKQQGFAKQQALKYFNKSTFCNIVLFLKANEIMEFRLVNRLFNKLFIECAPVLLENLEKKEDDYFQKQHNNPQKLELPKLMQVDLKELKQNLENRGMYACVDKLHGDNLFSVELIYLI